MKIFEQYLARNKSTRTAWVLSSIFLLLLSFSVSTLGPTKAFADKDQSGKAEFDEDGAPIPASLAADKKKKEEEVRTAKAKEEAARQAAQKEAEEKARAEGEKKKAELKQIDEQIEKVKRGDAGGPGGSRDNYALPAEQPTWTTVAPVADGPSLRHGQQFYANSTDLDTDRPEVSGGGNPLIQNQANVAPSAHPENMQMKQAQVEAMEKEFISQVAKELNEYPVASKIKENAVNTANMAKQGAVSLERARTELLRFVMLAESDLTGKIKQNEADRELIIQDIRMMDDSLDGQKVTDPNAQNTIESRKSSENKVYLTLNDQPIGKKSEGLKFDDLVDPRKFTIQFAKGTLDPQSKAFDILIKNKIGSLSDRLKTLSDQGSELEQLRQNREILKGRLGQQRSLASIGRRHVKVGIATQPPTKINSAWLVVLSSIAGLMGAGYALRRSKSVHITSNSKHHSHGSKRSRPNKGQGALTEYFLVVAIIIIVAMLSQRLFA